LKLFISAFKRKEVDGYLKSEYGQFVFQDLRK